jgi:hypothetical protein
MTPLAASEAVIDASGAAARIEAVLPAGARARQLAVRTLLPGMMITLADGRPAHLTRVRQALTALPEEDQRRLGVLADWKNCPHLLTYRQTEYTFRLVAGALGKDRPDGLPSPELQRTCDDLLEASVPEEFKDASASLAVDWSDLESFSRPPPRGTSGCADPEASWGHRRNNLRHDEDELFYGYYLSAAVTVPGEHGPPVPEFARRMTACSTQQTITVPPDVLAKTAQKHDYPSAAWRRSYARRSGAERSFATAKDPAANDIARGWCRLMGLTPLTLFTACLLAARNQRILAAWNARQEENTRRAAKGLPPKTRRRRRKTLTMITAAPP